MRNNIKKMMCMLLSILMILCSNSVMFADEKEYFTGTIEDITVDNKVFVTILHEYSGLDKEFSQEDFPDVKIVNIEYITSLKDPNKEYPYLNLNEYCQVIVLTLAEPGKENVLEAIRKLEDNPIVKQALPLSDNNSSNNKENEMTRLDGDVNLDSKVNAEDALIVLKASSKLEELTEDEIKYADVNWDGVVNAKDALLVLKMAAGL